MGFSDPLPLHPAWYRWAGALPLNLTTELREIQATHASGAPFHLVEETLDSGSIVTVNRGGQGGRK